MYFQKKMFLLIVIFSLNKASSAIKNFSLKQCHCVLVKMTFLWDTKNEYLTDYVFDEYDDEFDEYNDMMHGSCHLQCEETEEQLVYNYQNIPVENDSGDDADIEDNG